jgi:protein-S-isoprenylcysteine O-methyltransferase Ste14
MPAVVGITLGAWILLELPMRVRERLAGRGGTAQDRGTRALIAVSLVAGILLAALLGRPPARPGSAAGVCGLALMWAGIALREWAILTLGESFRTSVEVDPGQRVVERGPYRLIRHPSYTGILLVTTGFGITRGSWPSVAVALVLPLAALMRRISVEEEVLVASLGKPYAEYRSRTKRLIPGIW